LASSITSLIILTGLDEGRGEGAGELGREEEGVFDSLPSGLEAAGPESALLPKLLL